NTAGIMFLKLFHDKLLVNIMRNKDRFHFIHLKYRSKGKKSPFNRDYWGVSKKSSAFRPIFIKIM
ncbi:hypothetical protein, partial [Virgibacillus dokdonensis]|uniref:hypothetical protein n=1 Tax=Virgibacillus dokdonensis TaxID=302167 RepID=UPI001C6EF59C